MRERLTTSKGKQKIQIVLKKMNPEDVPVAVEKTTTIRELRELIVEKLKIDYKEQRIYHMGLLIPATDDGKTISELSIEDGDDIFVMKSNVNFAFYRIDSIRGNGMHKVINSQRARETCSFDGFA